MNLTFVPIEGAPLAHEFDGLTAVPDVIVVTTTYCDRDGNPRWLLERFADPDTQVMREVWSRVTDSLGYHRQ